MKAQMKAADRSGAAVAVIVGERSADGVVTAALRATSTTAPGRGVSTDLLASSRLERTRLPPTASHHTCGSRSRDRPHARHRADLASPVAQACAPTTAASCGRPTWAARCRVCGWVARRREHGEHLAFIDVRDRTGIVQCVVDGAADLRSEYVVRVTGTVRAPARGHGQRQAGHG